MEVIVVKANNLEQCNDVEISNGVLKLNGNLYLYQKETGQQQFQYFQGLKSVTEANFENFKVNILHNVNIAKVQGAQYLHIVYPAKAVVHTSKFKEFNIEIKPIMNIKHYLDNVLYGKSNLEHFEFDDTHHNDKGLYEIIMQAFDAINLKLPSLRPIYSFKNEIGDLGKMYGISPHTVEVFKGFQGLIKQVKVKKFSLAEFLPGNSGHIDYHLNGNGIIKKRLVLFGDSYFRKSLNILNTIFEEVIYFRTPYIIAELIQVLEPDIVWTGNAERYLVDVPNSMVPKPYFLNYFNRAFKVSEMSEELINTFNLLFSGKKNLKFINWKDSQIITICHEKQLNPLQINITDLKTKMDVNFCYRMAVFFETININYSYHLIKLAIQARPNGPLIVKLYNKYKLLHI